MVLVTVTSPSFKTEQHDESGSEFPFGLQGLKVSEIEREHFAWQAGVWVFSPRSVPEVARFLQWVKEECVSFSLVEATAKSLDRPLRLSLSRLNGIREYSPADLTVMADAGITIRQLQAELAGAGLHFPLVYAEDSRLGDVLAEDKPSLYTGALGYPRDYVLGLEVVTPDGEITKCGGKVVKNVTGYDLNKLYVGSHHMLGVVTAATLKLQALPVAEQSLLMHFSELGAILQFSYTILENAVSGLRGCEIIPASRMSAEYVGEREGYVLWLDLAGSTDMVESGLNQLEAKAENFCWEKREMLVREERDSFLASLTQWPLQTTIVEIALPYQREMEILDAVVLPWTEQWRDVSIQCRPAAGLVYLIFDDASVESAIQESSDTVYSRFLRLQAQLKQYDSFFQLIQWHPGLTGLTRRVNLPDCREVRLLMDRLKSTYDPFTLLRNLRLPLGLGQEALG